MICWFLTLECHWWPAKYRCGSSITFKQSEHSWKCGWLSKVLLLSKFALTCSTSNCKTVVICISSFRILRKFSWFIFWPWSGCRCIDAFSFSYLPHMKLLLFIPVSIILNHLFLPSSYKYLFPFMFSSFLLKSECAVYARQLHSIGPSPCSVLW